jgi:CRP-like cAMP-binding protein
LVALGYVDIVRKSPDNPAKEIHIVQLSDNSFFGENSFITGDHTRNASVRAGTYCDLMRLEHEDLEDLAQDFPDFQASVKKCMEEKEKSFKKPKMTKVID